MNAHLLGLEWGVLGLGLALLLADLWTPTELKRKLGYAAAAGLAIILAFSFAPFVNVAEPQYAFGQSYVLDGLSLFFKRFFLVTAIFVLVMGVEFSHRFDTGFGEYYTLILFALVGMMFAASANNFPMLFVALELITVSFYILTSFRRNRQASLEAGVKYLILGALSSAVLVYGIALVFGSTGSMDFAGIREKLTASSALRENFVLQAGMFMVVAGLAFKLAAFPFQMWAPDVYQGSPAPTTAFLAVGSKAAGVVLLMRLLGNVIPAGGIGWERMVVAIAAITILYGSLCAIPQRNLKRLMGYSSIASAGYIFLGFTVMNKTGSAAILYYLGGYLFTVLAAFTVLSIVFSQTENEEISSLAGLNERSPILATALTMAMVSLAGIPPLAGFVGKFFLIKAVISQGMMHPGFFLLLTVALIGVVISLYYYFGVIRAIYWSREPIADLSPIAISLPSRIALYLCMLGMLWLGIFPSSLLSIAETAVKSLKL